MSKLGDLFVRLGLRKDDFSKGIDGAKKELKGFEAASKTMAGVATAAWAAVAAAVVKFAKDAISLTQKWGDEWNVTMAGVKGAYQTFVRQLSSGEGFDNLFANMREAARVARETARSLDEVFERTISGNYRTAQLDNEIADLQKIMYDQSKSEKERLDAADKIKQKNQERYTLLKDIQQQEADGYRQLFQSQTKLNDEQTDFLVKEYNANRQVINQARQYREERQKAYNDALAASKRVGSVGVTYDYNAADAAARAVDAKYSQSVRNIAELTKAYDKSNDELVANMANAEVAVINLDTQMKHATDRADRLIGRLTKDNGGSGGSGKAQQDIAAEQAAKLYQQTQDAAKKEVELLNEKYATEKALLEKYGYDTAALTTKHNAEILDAVTRLQQDLVNIPPVTIDVFDIDMSKIDGLADGIEEELAIFEQAQELAKEINDAIVTGFSGACQEMMDQLMGVQEFNMGAVIKALLEPLADMAVKEGEILLATGVGVEACKKALESLNGYAAIAAGVALIAIGTAAKAGLAALARSGSTNTSSSTYSGGSSAAAAQNIDTELTIHVEGRLSGSDIVLSGQKTLNNWNR